MNQEVSWCTLIPGIVNQDKTAIFGPQDINPVASHTFRGSQDAGIYTRKVLRGFWDRILINAASRTALRKFSQNLIVYTAAQEGTNSLHYYNPRTEFFVANMISIGYFKDQFWTHLGLSCMYLSIAEFTSRFFIHQAYIWCGFYGFALHGNW